MCLPCNTVSTTYTYTPKSKTELKRSVKICTTEAISAEEFRNALEQLFGKNQKPSSLRAPRSLIGDGTVFELKNFLSRDECARLIQLSESHGYSLMDQRQSRHSHSQYGRITIASRDLAKQLWERLVAAGAFKKIEEGDQIACGVNPNFRFYRYRRGDRWDVHFDDSVTIHTNDGTHETLYSLLVYLNSVGDVTDGGDPLQGGETMFFKDVAIHHTRAILKVAPKVGSALAYVHGERCLPHAEAEVKSGVKYLFRTDIIFGRICTKNDFDY